MQLVFCGTGWLSIVDAIRARLPSGATIRVRDMARALVDDVREANVLVPSNARLDAAVIATPPDLRLVQQSAVGYELIDLPAARRRGVPVCNAPGTNADSVAQAALLLILALARRLPVARRMLAEARIGVPLGVELSDKTLGIVGLGRSGSRLAGAARALGMSVVSVRSTSTPAEIESLLRVSDFVSIHCPLTPATRGLFDDAAFARMKPGARLVNCARAAIVDRAALQRALETGRLAGAGLDVHWDEPWDPRDPLFARDDVVALPHVAGSTEESFARIADVVAENVRRLMAGEPLLNRVG